MKTKRAHPELHGFGDQKVYDRAYWHKRGRENIAAGLTWHGEKRKRELRPDLAEVHGNARHVIKNQERAERFMAQGLTWRGTVRKKRSARVVTPVEQLYRELRADVRAPLNFEDVFQYGRENYA